MLSPGEQAVILEVVLWVQLLTTHLDSDFKVTVRTVLTEVNSVPETPRLLQRSDNVSDKFWFCLAKLNCHTKLNKSFLLNV